MPSTFFAAVLTAGGLFISIMLLIVPFKILSELKQVRKAIEENNYLRRMESTRVIEAINAIPEKFSQG
jgi:hypothetical protein